MFKKALMGLVISYGLATSAVAGDLKTNMAVLSSDLTDIQMSFFMNDMKQTLASTKKLSANVSKILGNEKAVKALLPDAVKNKSGIALNSAEVMERNIKQIEYVLTSPNYSMITKQMESQKAFAEIQNQCFRCHNLVRDWK